MLIANRSTVVICLLRGLMCFLLLRHKPPSEGPLWAGAPEGKRTVPSSILPNPLPLDRKEDKYCCRCLTLCKWDFSSQIYQALAGCLRLWKLGPRHDKMAAHVSESPAAVLLPKGYDDTVKSMFSCCAGVESLISTQRSKWSSGLFIFGVSPFMKKAFFVCVGPELNALCPLLEFSLCLFGKNANLPQGQRWEKLTSLCVRTCCCLLHRHNDPLRTIPWRRTIFMLAIYVRELGS